MRKSKPKGDADTGNPVRFKDGSFTYATGNYAKPGWRYHPTKGFRKA